MRASSTLELWGIDLRRVRATARGIGQVRRHRAELEQQQRASGEPDLFPITAWRPMIGDGAGEAGQASGHYFHQDLLVAREILQRAPRRHIDVGSSIYGFVSHVATFREIEVIDVRPLRSSIEGIVFRQMDLMSPDPALEGAADSVSCLHALEHFGLGRYGDPVDRVGWRRGLVALTGMLEPSGTLYLSVPTGEPQRTEFNAHRVFSLPFLRDVLLGDFEIERLAFVRDGGDLVAQVDPWGDEAARSLDAAYGCSIWILRKRAAPGNTT